MRPIFDWVTPEGRHSLDLEDIAEVLVVDGLVLTRSRGTDRLFPKFEGETALRFLEAWSTLRGVGYWAAPEEEACTAIARVLARAGRGYRDCRTCRHCSGQVDPVSGLTRLCSHIDLGGLVPWCVDHSRWEDRHGL